MKNSKIRALVTLVASLAAVAAFALPAAADVSPTVVVFSGTAEVSPALHFPGVGPAESGTWAFGSGVNDTITVPDDCQAIGAHTGACSIGASGSLGAVAGPLGAWCGMSSGSGAGSAQVLGNTVDITSIGWIASAGSILPLNGTWADTHGGGGTGTIVGAVQAFGGSECALGGASNFDVVGIAVLV